jgi:diguanylate cyclase (GGDEF)-like protein/PAS domain S-box-containing protein
MQTGPNFYVSFIYLLAAVPYAWLGLFAWRKRPAVAVTPFAWTMLGLSIWSFAYSLELFFPTLPLKILFAKVEFTAILSIPAFFLFFSFEYVGKRRLLTWGIQLLAWALPIAGMALMWSNELHHLMWERETLINAHGLIHLVLDYDLLYRVSTIYSYGLTLFASALLVMEFMQRPGSIYRVQISVMILAILAPLAGSLLHNSRFNPIPYLDITPLLLLPVSLGLSWAIMRYRLLEILPLEHLSVLRNMKDGIIVVNFNKRILYVNPLAESLMGCEEKDVIGQPVSHISKKHGEMLAALLAGDERRSEMTIGTGEQAQIFEVTISPVLSSSGAQNLIGPDSMITLHDITERKKVEINLGRRESIMSAISFAAERFLREAAWEHNIPATLERIGLAIDASRVYVFMNYADEKGVIHTSQCYEWAAAGITPQIDNPDLKHINLREAGFSRWEERLSKGIIIHGNLRDFPPSEQDILQGQNILSLAVVPIFVENQWWGFIGFDECRYERPWKDSELEALRIVASIFGSAEVRARAELRLVRRQQALTLLQEIVSEALRAKTLRHMAADASVRLVSLIGASDCFITLWDEAGAQVSPLASQGKSTGTYLSLQPVSGGHTLTELALRLGHALIVNDVHNSPYLDREIAAQCPSHSLIVLPLIAAKNKLGAIILAFKEYHKFQPEEISICEQASHLIELAFEKFRAMEQAQRRADTSETLRKAGVAIAETLETDEAVTRILEQLKQVIPYDSASVQLINGDELEIVGGSGFADPKAVIGIRFAVHGDNPNSVVVETEKPYLLRNVGDVYGEFKKPPHNHIKSWLGVPLIAQNKLIGLLSIDSSEESHFTDDDISIAVTFANQVSITLENARMFQEAQSQALTDPLTGVYNRRGLLEMAAADFAKAIARGYSFSGIMIDLDYFKNVNDTHGHDIGDQVLCEAANRFKNCIRGLDYVGRYGGEEFLVVLPETNLNTARIVAERLRKVLADNPVSIGDGLEINVTASLGIANRDENTKTLEILITRADQALYVAKHNGRNRVAAST